MFEFKEDEFVKKTHDECAKIIRDYVDMPDNVEIKWTKAACGEIVMPGEHSPVWRISFAFDKVYNHDAFELGPRAFSFYSWCAGWATTNNKIDLLRISILGMLADAADNITAEFSRHDWDETTRRHDAFLAARALAEKEDRENVWFEFRRRLCRGLRVNFGQVTLRVEKVMPKTVLFEGGRRLKLKHVEEYVKLGRWKIAA